ncbi:MAG: sulfite exporter TauE/SafE family protein [Gammaproteobacteria bacterium]|nr:sulfite exporter TauE/SafE family protein [Gammaproteobacteria bacterium]
MPIDFSYATAFLVGFFGGVHCVGMCGGIVGALTFGLSPEKRKQWSGSFPYILVYNLGRVLSYTIAGAVVAGISLLALDVFAIHQAQTVLKAVAGLFMLVLGFYLGGWWNGLLKIEKLGSRLWKYIEPLGRKLMPVQTLPQAFVLGMIWGWLPCGLVYSVLIFTLTATSIQDGALIMLSFGLGTLPTVISMGLMAAMLSAFVRQPWVRHVAGALVVLFGIMMLWQATDSYGSGWLSS